MPDRRWFGTRDSTFSRGCTAVSFPLEPFFDGIHGVERDPANLHRRDFTGLRQPLQSGEADPDGDGSLSGSKGYSRWSFRRVELPVIHGTSFSGDVSGFNMEPLGCNPAAPLFSQCVRLDADGLLYCLDRFASASGGRATRSDPSCQFSPPPPHCTTDSDWLWCLARRHVTPPTALSDPAHAGCIGGTEQFGCHWRR